MSRHKYGTCTSTAYRANDGVCPECHEVFGSWSFEGVAYHKRKGFPTRKAANEFIASQHPSRVFLIRRTVVPQNGGLARHLSWQVIQAVPIPQEVT